MDDLCRRRSCFIFSYWLPLQGQYYDNIIKDDDWDDGGSEDDEKDVDDGDPSYDDDTVIMIYFSFIIRM